MCGAEIITAKFARSAARFCLKKCYVWAMTTEQTQNATITTIAKQSGIYLEEYATSKDVLQRYKVASARKYLLQFNFWIRLVAFS